MESFDLEAILKMTYHSSHVEDINEIVKHDIASTKAMLVHRGL